jgi:hypothetical protein
MAALQQHSIEAVTCRILYNLYHSTSHNDTHNNYNNTQDMLPACRYLACTPCMEQPIHLPACMLHLILSRPITACLQLQLTPD